MKKLRNWELAAVIGVVIFTAIWLGIAEWTDREVPLNKADAFVLKETGQLYWFELTSRFGKVEGTYHQQKIIEEPGKEPLLQDKHYTLKGEKTEKGYLFNLQKGVKGTTMTASFSRQNLYIQKQGGNESYAPVSQEELKKYKKELHQELEYAIYHAEEKENNRIRNFFAELRRVYGYLYTAEDDSFQVFIKFDEALLEGELAGSLIMSSATGNKNNQIEETRYAINGITDGLMIRLFTVADGKETRLKGNFHGNASEFETTFWTSNEKLLFHGVTEEEYKLGYDEFKKEAYRGR